MCLAFGVERLDDVGAQARATCSRCSRRRARRQGARPPEAQVDRRLAAERPCAAGAVPGDRAHAATTSTSALLPDPDAAGRATRRRSSRCPAVITRDPRTGGAQRRHVPDAGARPRARPFMHWQIHKDGRADWLASGGRHRGRGRARPRPGHRLLGERAAAEAHRRADARRLPARRAGRARQGRDRRPRGARARRDRARGLRRAAASSATKGPFGDHTGYYTPAEPFPVFHVTAMTMRRDAIYPSIVVGKPPQEDAWLGKATERIFLPAIRATRARDRRLRPAGRGRVPQLLHRLDPQGVPRPRARR